MPKCGARHLPVRYRRPMSRAPQPEWTVYAHSTDSQLHPLGAPPVPRAPEGGPVAALSWITGVSPDHGVLRTLAVHTAADGTPAALTTWRHTGGGEPELDPVSCLRRDLLFHAGQTARQVPVGDETHDPGDGVRTTATARTHGMTWRAYRAGGLTVTLAHHDDDTPDWSGGPVG